MPPAGSLQGRSWQAKKRLSGSGFFVLPSQTVSFYAFIDFDVILSLSAHKIMPIHQLWGFYRGQNRGCTMKKSVFNKFCLLGFFLLWVLPVGAADRYVAPTGTDLGSCTNPSLPCKTINCTADHAVNEDVVKVVQGTYNENIEVSLDSGVGHGGFTLQGGWSPDFSTRQTDPSLTVIDGGGAGRVKV